MANKYRWIREEYVIDFELPDFMHDLFREAEEADLAGSAEYFQIADSIDVCAKNLCEAHRLTQHQWDTIVCHYTQRW